MGRIIDIINTKESWKKPIMIDPIKKNITADSIIIPKTLQVPTVLGFINKPLMPANNSKAATTA